jgi:tRNA(fMet)-specific endonuclease VapC
MPVRRHLLDTNVVVRFMRGDAAIGARLASTPIIVVSAIVLGELYFGAQKSKRVGENLRKINRFVAGKAVVPCDIGTAYEYGIIKYELEDKGRPIPDNDIWLAAIARQYNFVLASGDSHFAEVDGLTWETW